MRVTTHPDGETTTYRYFLGFTFWRYSGTGASGWWFRPRRWVFRKWGI